MFPTQSKANRLARLWLLPAFALVMLLLAYVVFAYSSAEAQTVPVPPAAATPPGDYCVEGIVINWEERPLAGWAITLRNESGTVLSTTVSASKPTDDENGDGEDDELRKGEFEFQNLPKMPDIYTATIESREGWEGVTPTTITFPINVGEDDCVRIRFKMRRIIPVEVIKFDRNHVGLEDWKIVATPGPGNLFATEQKETTNVTGTALFTLTPGSWIFTEYPPKTDWDEPREAWMPVVPPSGRQELKIEDRDYLTAELPIQIVFKNELVVGCIVVQKIGIIPATTNDTAELVSPIGNTNIYTGTYGVPGWTMTLYRKDGSIARQGVTDATGQVMFDNLPLGPYTLKEENRAGWAERVDASTPFEVREQDVEVKGNFCDDPADFYYFRNEQDESGFCIEGYKIDANEGYGLPDWEIKIKPLDEGGFDPGDVRTDGRGYYRFDFPRDDYRIPGAKYEVCEDEEDGWLPHTDTCQTVRLPEWPMGECVQLKDFVNQQVGHSEREKMEKDKGKGGMWMGGGDMGGKPVACSSYHVVEGGEGLYDIGRMYKKSPQQMLDANPDVKNNKNQWVFVGQKICIP